MGIDEDLRENSEAEQKPLEEENSAAKVEAEAVEPEKVEELEEAIEPEKVEVPEEAEASEESENEASDENQASENKAEDDIKPEEAADTPQHTEIDDEPYVDKSLIQKSEAKLQKKKKIKKTCLITGISILGTAAVAYIVIAVWFCFHYTSHTIIDDEYKSYTSVADLNSQINNFIDTYAISINTNDGESYVLNGSDIDLDIETVYGAKDIIKAQHPFMWPFYMKNIKNYNIEYQVTYDKDKLEQVVSEFDFMNPDNMVLGEDAYVEIKDGKTCVVDATEGTEIDEAALLDALDEAINSTATALELSGTDCYIKPEITADSQEIADIKEKADKILDVVITYNIDQVSWTLDRDTFGDWLYYQNGNWQIDHEKIEEYVAQMAETYDTLGTTRKFRTATGRIVYEEGNKYGWQIDQTLEVSDIGLILRSGNSQTKEPEFSQRGVAYSEDNDIGSTYVEVDLTNQHVYVIYEGTVVLDTDCVTGSVAAGHDTPDGLYAVTYKQSPAVLRGDDYESHVSYWMPFNGGIGLHDATWRSKFGGTIYKSSGSHGCVNLPLAAAKEIYGYISAGTPVVCYY